MDFQEELTFYCPTVEKLLERIIGSQQKITGDNVPGSQTVLPYGHSSNTPNLTPLLLKEDQVKRMDLSIENKEEEGSNHRFIHRWLQNVQHFDEIDDVPGRRASEPFEDFSNTPNPASPFRQEVQLMTADVHIEQHHREEGSNHRFIDRWLQNVQHFDEIDDVPGRRASEPFEEFSSTPNPASPFRQEVQLMTTDVHIEQHNRDEGSNHRFIHRWVQNVQHFDEIDDVPGRRASEPFEEFSSTPNPASPFRQEVQLMTTDVHIEQHHREEGSNHRFIDRWLQNVQHFDEIDDVPGRRASEPFEEFSSTPNPASPFRQEVQLMTTDVHIEQHHREEGSNHRFIDRWLQNVQHFDEIDDVPGRRASEPFEEFSSTPNPASPFRQEVQLMTTDVHIEQHNRDEGYKDLNPNTTPPYEDSNITSLLLDEGELIKRDMSIEEEKEVIALEVTDLAATMIQMSNGQNKCSNIYDQETQHEHNDGAKTNELISGHPKSRNVSIDGDREQGTSIRMVEESCLAPRHTTSDGYESDIEENEIDSMLSYSNVGNIQLENANHSGKKNWWRPSTWAGNSAPIKNGWRPFKSSDDHLGEALQLVKKVPAFRLLEDHVLHAICKHLCFKVYSKSSYIFREKKPVHHMLFIVGGKLEYDGKNGTTGSIEDFCGEELLFWHTDMTGGRTSKRIYNRKYPFSSRTVKCMTNVEGFSLDSNALKYITTHYEDSFRSRHVQGAMRYFSFYWRSLAATQIQKSWRSMKKRKSSACHGQREWSIISDEETSQRYNYDSPKNNVSRSMGHPKLENAIVYQDTKPEEEMSITEEMTSTKHQKLENAVVDRDTKPEEESSIGIAQEESLLRSLASSFTESMGDKSNITENDSYKSTPDPSKSNVGKVQRERNDLVGKKPWWRPSIKLGGDPSGKKNGWGILKPGGENSGTKNIGLQPVVKKEDMVPQLERVPKRFSHKQLRAATGGFSEESKLGSGCFGSMYQGVLPSSDIAVAVKKMKGFSTSRKGAKEFATNVSIIIRQLKHENLVAILGCCEDVAKKEYLLVYEFMPNGNLANALFGPSEKGTTCLSWPQRLNIVIDLADALEYLHEGRKQPVIHGNIKPSNILFDKEWNAKLGDVGLARLAHQHSTSISIVAPTIGYMAPEGFNSQNVTDKIDVFAFGAVVLEIASGRKAISDSVPPEEMVLVDWVWNSQSGEGLLSTVDKRLENYDTYSMEVLLKVGLLCCHPDPLARPSMRQVVQVLAGVAPVPSIAIPKPTPVFGSVPQSKINDLHSGKEDLVMPFAQGIPQRFSYKQLWEATKAFSKESELGQGGFGSVHQGVLPSSNVPVAVKRMNSTWAQGQGVKEFMAEVSIIIRLRHRNLIELLGWCEDVTKTEYLLVYELMPNGSLDDKLFERPGKETICLSWSQRFNIVKGTAAALEYLHQGWKQQVIHRDIKCSNILLDEEWNAQLGDFGLARMVDRQQGAATTSVVGTMGYIAPEVFADGKFTDKADVFGFGAVVLEVACGRRVSRVYPEEMGLVDWVWNCLREEDLLSAVDTRLSDYDTYWMKVLLMVGLLCTDPDPLARPSIRQVVLILAGDVPVPSIPASKPTRVFYSAPHRVSIHDLPSKKQEHF